MENFPLPKNVSKITRFEHLRTNISPIRAAIIDTSIPLDSQTQVAIDTIKQQGDFIDYYEDDVEKLKQASIQGSVIERGESNYVVSEANSRDKYSEEYRFCTGILVVGKDKNTGENISLLTHQDPGELSWPSNSFKQALANQISKITEQCEAGTIEAVIVGGALNEKAFGSSASQERHDDNIKTISSIISPVIGFEPIVMTGPNNEGGTTQIYFENDSRHLYILRKQQQDNSMNHSYRPSDIDELSETLAA